MMKHSSGHVFPDMVISDQENITLHWHIFPNMTILDQQNIEKITQRITHVRTSFQKGQFQISKIITRKNLRGHVQ